MKPRIPAFLCAGLIAALLAGTTGCSRPSDGVPKQSNMPSIELRLMDYTQVDQNAIRSANAAFAKKHPNVKVTMVDSKPLGPHALDGADLVLLTSEQFFAIAPQGWLKPLPAATLPSLDPGVLGVYDQLGSVNGTRYGLPFSITPVMLAMNAKALSQASITPPDHDWTWADFEQILTAAKAASQGAATTGSANPTVQIDAAPLLDPLLRSYGGQVYDADAKAWRLDTPQAAQGLEEMGRLLRLGAVATTTAQPSSNHLFSLVTERTPALPGTVLMPLPRGPQGRPVPVTGALAAVSAASLQADLAAEYVRDLIGAPANQLALAQARIRPVTADQKAMAAWRQAIGTPSADAWDVSLQAACVGYIPGSAAEVITGLKPYFQGQQSLSATLAQLLPTLPPE
jgi:ABC-type glycerol-3-phosphate transport system substrate-binding protein